MSGAISIKLADGYQMEQVEDNRLYNQDQNGIIQNEMGFPIINIADFRKIHRLDGTATTERIKDCLLEAMAHTNQELAQASENINFNQENDLFIFRYQRAVFSFALANLYERYASFDNTKDGTEKGQALKESVNELRRDGRNAINDLCKRTRVNAELL